MVLKIKFEYNKLSNKEFNSKNFLSYKIEYFSDAYEQHYIILTNSGKQIWCEYKILLTYDTSDNRNDFACISGSNMQMMPKELIISRPDINKIIKNTKYNNVIEMCMLSSIKLNAKGIIFDLRKNYKTCLIITNIIRQ